MGLHDNQSKSLKINLKPGEYTIIVTAEDYQPWRKNILLLGNEYKQTALARLKKQTDEK